MGVLPAGIGATSVQGLDVGLLGSLPVVVALLLDGPPPAAVVAVQWVWAAPSPRQRSLRSRDGRPGSPV
jgi:hypothetical protein